MRDAFVASQACTAPPVRFQSSQLSIVPAHSSPRSARAVAIGDGVEQPADLAGGEQRIDRQAGPLFDDRLQAALAQRLAERRRSAALPDDGRADRPAGRAFPDQDGLALVRRSRRHRHVGPVRAPGTRRRRPRHCARARRASCSTQPGRGNAIVDRRVRARHDVRRRRRRGAPSCSSCPDRSRGRAVRPCRLAPHQRPRAASRMPCRRRGRSAPAGTRRSRSAQTRPARRAGASAPDATRRRPPRPHCRARRTPCAPRPSRSGRARRRRTMLSRSIGRIVERLSTAALMPSASSSVGGVERARRP